jgi:hypothetical protein
VHFEEIEPGIIRYPAINAADFRTRLDLFLTEFDDA